jgi:hypothetical protein
MKIAILAVRDTGGTAYTLAHAINKVAPENQAINIVGITTYIRYPMMVDMGDYSRTKIREMIYGSDVLVFLGAMQPFFDAMHLQKKYLKDKKKMLLCMGSEWRLGRDDLMKQADKLLGGYKIVLGGADMFMPIDCTNPETKEEKHFGLVDDGEVSYLPVVRAMDEIEEKYGISKADEAALNSFAVPRKRVVFTHAPTSEANKGSHIFYRAVTRAQQAVKDLTFTAVRQQTWASTLGVLSKSDVLLDQAPPFPTAYGALSIEAGIFRLPSFSQVAPECHDFILKHTGLKTPHIKFSDEEDLFQKMLQIASNEKLRRELGQMNYDFCKHVHDEKPVVERFLKLVEKM